MNTPSKVIVGLGIAIILGYFGWQRFSGTNPDQKTPDVTVVQETTAVPTSSEQVFANIWSKVSVEWMPWSAIAGGIILLVVVVLILKKLLKKEEGEEKPEDKKAKEKGKEKESATKKNILTSIWFWIIILILAVGFISYWFQKEIEQWIRSGGWRHLPLWVYITGGLALLIMVLWVVGKDRLGKFLALTAIVAVIALAFNSVTGGLKSLVGNNGGSILTTTQLEGVEVINITPENPVARVYRESWEGIIERTPFDDEVEIYIPPQGARIYDNQGNLIIDRSYTYPLVSENKGNLSPNQRTGYRFYYSPRNMRAVVHIVPSR